MIEPESSPEPEEIPLRRIRVLLATYNGARYLDEQLHSLAAQDVAAALDIIASDDGSTDGTRALLEGWQRRWRRGRFTIVAGPRQGFTENFRSLMRMPEAAGDYVAFCDQDDVWMPDKLATALAVLSAMPGPGLYCSRTQRVDAALRPIGFSPLFRRPPHFRNALVQSIAGGNTMVMNAPAFALVAESARRTSFVSHDWWCYLLISGAGGRVHYDPEPHVAYRQHGGNAVGDNVGWRARWQRLKMSLAGRFAEWNAVNLAALEACRDLLTAEARDTMRLFALARQAGPLRGLATIVKSGIYRQSLPGNVSLVLAALLRKI